MKKLGRLLFGDSGDNLHDDFPAILLREGLDPEGRTWRIVIIEEGWSKNRVFYPADVLRDGEKLFEGARVFAYDFPSDYYDHLPDPISQIAKGGLPRNIVGWIDGVRYEKVQGSSGSTGALTGDLHVTDDFFKNTFKAAWDQGKKDLLGFSIDADGTTEPFVEGGRSGKRVKRLVGVQSVDVVSLPAAGGRLLRLVASIINGKEENEMKSLLAKFLRENPQMLKLAEGTDLKGKSDDDVVGMLFEALSKELGDKAPKADKTKEAMVAIDADALAKLSELVKAKKIDEALSVLAGLLSKGGQGYGYSEPARASVQDPAAEGDKKAIADAAAKADKALASAMAMESKAAVRESLAAVAGKLPAPVIEKLRASFDGKTVELKDIQAAVQAEVDVFAKLVESGQVKGMGDKDRAEVLRTSQDKLQAAMDLMVGYVPGEADKAAYAGVQPFAGLRAAWGRFTGDSEARGGRLTESTSGDFPLALGVSMTRRMVQEYRRQAQRDIWSKFVSEGPVSNFKTQTAIRWGGLASLGIVTEDNAYQPLASPSEEKSEYAARKRGGIFSITMEMIKNDDIRALQKVPVKLGQAANRTLAQFVYDLLVNYGGTTPAINGGTIYDATALYTSGHANKGTSALDFSTLLAGIVAMANQAEADSAEPLAIQPAFLVVPTELRATAIQLVSSEHLPNSPNNDVNPVFKAVEPLVVPKGFLRASAKNWYLVASPADVETIELGYLDDRRDPEILVQDSGLVGDVFAKDEIKYKVRHIYGGAVVDFRGFFGAIVP